MVIDSDVLSICSPNAVVVATASDVEEPVAIADDEAGELVAADELGLLATECESGSFVLGSLL